jgi:hypothetical protein
MKFARPLSLAASLLMMICTIPARAALGETATSIQSDATVLKSAVTQRSVARPEFTVQRLTLPNGTAVDEFLSPSGTVFAVTWHGIRPPDLSQLLGSYFVEYQTAATQPHLRSNHVHIDTGRMIYRAGGHMRAYWGSAHVPSLLPAGVTAGDIQ